jgi:CTP:molybdopterin cytidylyltransferase MocA
VIEAVLDAWCASRVEHVAVVLHPNDRELAEICRGRMQDVVVLPAGTPDMKATVLAALAHLEAKYRPAADDPWLLAPADMPTLGAGVIDRVLEAYADGRARESETADRPGAGSIVAAARGGVRGHPIAMPWHYRMRVQRLPAGEGINALLATETIRLIECDEPAVLDDMDTLDEYQRLARREGST